MPLTTDPAISHPLPFNDSYIYQRIFKTDDFKVGGRLEFNALGNKLVMAFPHCGGPETINMARAPVKSQEREKEKDKDHPEKGREKMMMTSGSQASHAFSSHGHGMLPPGAQYPAYMMNQQGTYVNPALAQQYHPQLPNLYPNSQPNPLSSPLQPTRDGRERARSPPQVQKSRTRIDIV